jgi:HSP20 family protein
MHQIKRTWTLFVPDTRAAWTPNADVLKTREGWLLRFDLAGVRLEDVTVSVQGHLVTISGVRKNATVEEGSSYYRMEIAYNQFERTIEMPVRLDRARIGIEARDGILTVRISTEGNLHVR